MHKTMKRLLSLLLALAMIASLSVTSVAALAEGRGVRQLATEELDPATLNVPRLGTGAADEPAEEAVKFAPNDVVRVSIFLKTPATLDRYSSRNVAQNAEAIKYRDGLKLEQKSLTSTIENKLNVKLDVKWNLTLAVNAISANVRYGDIAKIEKLDGVKSVELERQYAAPDPVSAEPNTANTSENMVGAVAAWAAGYTGAGSKVAIIDTGLDTDHQSVNADALNYAITQLQNETGKTYQLMTQADLNAIPTSQLNSGTRNYLNAKVPYAYNYVDHSTRVNHQDSGSNHGSHVAGIAAANRFIKQGSSYVDAVETVKAVGMAPDAQIFVMKVFSSSGASDSDYFAALEDAIVLGADAANLSLGSASPGWTYDSTYQEKLNSMVNNTTNGHMVLSISAGNSDAYDDHTSHKLYAEDAFFHTGGSPGSFINSLGVASANNTLTEGKPLVFNGSQKVFYAESTEDSDGNTYTNPEIATIAGTYDYVYIDATGTAADYQAVNGAVSLSGKVVIVNRGDLSFSEKGNNANSYNPKAVIVANNQDGTIYMNLADFTGTFPMVAILLKDANTIKANSTSAAAGGVTYYTGSVQVTNVEESMVAAREDTEISDFSSWGVPGSLIMKPEIAAPGGNIYSIYGTSSSDSGSGTTAYASFSGTSMAAPHITGLSAVVMQYLRENAPANTDLTGSYNLRAIAQSLLMSTATPMINEGAYLPILRQGAGLADVSLAIGAKSVIMMNEAGLTTSTGAAADGKVKVELGDDPERTGEYDYSFTVYNISDETLTFELDTDLFTQAISGDTLSHKTTLLPAGGVTYEWNGAAAVIAEGPDVDMDGDTDEDDAQAILDHITGIYEGDFDAEAADMDEDGSITTYDAYLLLNWQPEGGETPEGYTVAPHDKAEVTVHIKLTEAQKAVFEARENGGYIEGYTYVTSVGSTREGESLEHEHAIPILGYYGSWTDPEMFDTNSYTEALYGSEQLNYSGAAAQDTNLMRITTGGTMAKFSGNPYIVEDRFPDDRLAIRSDSVINNIAYNLIRPAAGTAFAVSKLDDNGGVTDIKQATVTGSEVLGAWYHANNQAWQNTSTKTYNVNKSLNQFSGLSDGDRVRVGFYAIPEYNAMKHSTDLTNAEAGVLTEAKFREMLTSGELGKGAFVGFDLTIDDVAPTIEPPVLEGTTLSITAADDKNIAYIGVLSLDGTVAYAEVAPGVPTYTVTFDASNAIANANGYIAAFVGDYAGNEAAYAVRVNDNTTVEKTVYVLTDTVAADQDYLIMSTNQAGTGYGLYYTLNATQTTATTAAFAAPINAGIPDTGNKPYVELADVQATGVWTAGTGSTTGTFIFGNNGWYLRRSNSNALTITKDTSRRDWTWDGTNNRLSNNSRYLRYYNNTFSLNSAVNSVYMYVKTAISSEVDPYSVSSVTVTPNTLDLYRGDTAALTANVAPLTASPRTVTWSSSNTSIATVDELGVVTAVAAGTATIRATSTADATKYGECVVTVTAINKELSAAIWDEDGDVYFSYFNANNLPNWTKRHNDPTGVFVTSAFMPSTSALYAATNDLSTSYIYSVNRTTYAMTELGENYVVPFGMAPVSAYFGTGYYVYAFATYIIFGNLEPETDDELGTYCGFPYGLLDLTETDVGEAYAVAVCVRNRSTSTWSAGTTGYYFLDETGKIWQTNMTYSNSFTFSAPTLVYDTGINAGLQYNSIYYDGTNLYWTHQQDNEAVLYILANANTAASRKFYRAGNFGEGVWPAAGLYTNGSVAPASVEEPISLDGLRPLMTRDQLMTEEVMARFAAASATQTVGSANSAPAAEELGEPEYGDDNIVTVEISETAETVTNGLYTVSYDLEAVEFVGVDTPAGFKSVFNDKDANVVTFAFADKDGIDGQRVGMLEFRVIGCTDTEVTVNTIELNDDLDVGDTYTAAFNGVGHAWGEPTWTWDGVTNAVAEFVCANNSEHTQTLTAAITRDDQGDKAVYTATVELDGETYTDTKEVEIAYYLIGSISEWAVSETYKFAPNEDAEGEYILNVSGLPTGAEIKVVRAEGSTILTWYPDNYGNYTVDYAHSGNVNVYFRPASNNDWWSFHDGGFFYISKLHTVTVMVPYGNGTAYADPETPDVTATVTINATPDVGYHFDHVEFLMRVGEGDDNLAHVDIPFDAETMTFTMPDYDVVVKVYFSEHAYGEITYDWADDYESCTATCTCTVCGHVETETAGTVNEVTKPATCEEPGETTYTTTFTNPLFTQQTMTVANIPATGHAWGEPTYVWSEDYATCTATAICQNDETHVLTETASAISAVITPAGCEEAGTLRWSAAFENELFEAQYVDVDIAPIGHVWGAPAYVWSDDNTTCTATAICENDETHVLTETVNAVYTVVTEPTVEAPGLGRYTATFENELFETQIVDVEIPQLEPQGYHINVHNYTSVAAATTSIDPDQLYSGEVTFTVDCGLVCVVFVDNGDGTYTRLVCTDADDAHSYTVTVTDADVDIVIVVRGDTNLNGKLETADSTLVKRAVAGLTPLSGDTAAIKLLAADVNFSGTLQTADSTLILRAVAGLAPFNW